MHFFNLLIFFLFTLNLQSSFSQVLTSNSEKPRLFLYSSDLPVKLQESANIFRKHIIDIVLLHQKHDLMLSEIPDKLVKGKTPQFILKYKLRTKNAYSYNLTYVLIDIDKLIVKKEFTFSGINQKELIEKMRLNLTMFLSGKKLSSKQKEKIKRITKNRINKIGNIQKITKKPIEQKTPSIAFQEPEKKINLTTKIAKAQRSRRKSPKAQVPKQGSIWALLRDDDIDIPWVEAKKFTAGATPINNKKKVETPFNEGSSIKNYNEKLNELTYNRFHISYKCALRQLKIDDIIDTDTEYQSVLGFSLEWLNYAPLYISPIVFRLRTEFDTPLETTPVQLDGHFNVTTSLGYRIRNKHLIGLSYEIDRMNFPNLNQIGSTVVANSFTVYWLDLDYTFLKRNYNLTASIGTLLNTKNSGKEQSAELRAKSDFTGHSLNVKFRYYLEDRYIGDIQLWYGVQFRSYLLSRNNDNGNTYVNATNYIYHLGMYF